MKILYTSATTDIRRVSDSFETHFIEVARNLMEIGNELLLLVAGYTPRDKGDSGFSVTFIPSGRRRFRSYLLVELLRAVYLPFMILKWRPHVIYARKDRFDFAVPIWARLFGVSYVVEVNGLSEDESRLYGHAEIKIRPSRLADKVNFGLATRVICVTSGIKQALIDRYRLADHRLVVIPNGANTNLFRPLDKLESRRRLGLEENAFYVGFVGLFEPWQGLETLLEAAKLLKEQGSSEVKYLLVGQGSLKASLTQKVREHGLEHEVLFVGSIPYDEVVYHINSFDVCYLGKERLTFGFSPLKLYEYLACGRPVISSRVEGVTELVEQGPCGYLFEPGDARQLADRILDSRKARADLGELGRNGRILVEQGYSWRGVARSIMLTLEQITI